MQIVELVISHGDGPGDGKEANAVRKIHRATRAHARKKTGSRRNRKKRCDRQDDIEGVQEKRFHPLRGGEGVKN